jgi:plastocyanin domain-containing protein
MRAPAHLLAAALLLAALPAAARAADQARPAAGATVAVKVTLDGFEPSRVPARKGQPLTLVITRTTDTTCATEIVVKEYGIDTPLPLGTPVSVTFTPTRSGQVKFACAMDMVGGVVVVP